MSDSNDSNRHLQKSTPQKPQNQDNQQTQNTHAGERPGNRMIEVPSHENGREDSRQNVMSLFHPGVSRMASNSKNRGRSSADSTLRHASSDSQATSAQSLRRPEPNRLNPGYVEAIWWVAKCPTMECPGFRVSHQLTDVTSVRCRVCHKYLLYPVPVLRDERPLIDLVKSVSSRSRNR